MYLSKINGYDFHELCTVVVLFCLMLNYEYEYVPPTYVFYIVIDKRKSRL